MVVESRWSVDIPQCSIPTWLFKSPASPRSDEKQFIDAEKPETHFITQEGYRLWSQRLALGLQREGLRPGDRVLIFSPSSIVFPVGFMGIVMAGGVFTGANPGFTARELLYQIRDSGATFILAADKVVDTAVQAATEAGLARSKIFTLDTTIFDAKPGTPRLGTRHWTELLASETDAKSFEWFEPSDPQNTTLCLNYSSGTTGVPKGVEITHGAYVANGEGVLHQLRLQDDYETWRARQKLLCFLPLYHAMAQTYFICNYPKLSMPIYVMSPFDFERFLRNVERFRITDIAAVPPIMVAIAKHPLVGKLDLSSVESIGCGAAPLGPEVCEEVVGRWPPGKVTLRQGWGMTELTCTGMGWPFGEKGIESMSVGEMMPNSGARLVDPETKEEIYEANKRGEVWISTPTLMKGYWKRPDATAETILTDEGGRRWLKTGDIAYVGKYGQGGRWYIVDRLKELIKVKGNQVAPAELEGVLLEHPGIIDAGVVGVTIDGEEYPRAYIVPHPTTTPSEADVAKYMEGKLIRYKWLRGGVRFVKEIPKNPSGKILRKFLREMAAKETSNAQAKL